MMTTRLKSTGSVLDALVWVALLAALLPGAAAKCDEGTLPRCRMFEDYRRVLAEGRDASILTLNMDKCRLKQSELKLLVTAFNKTVLPNLEEILLSNNRFEQLSPGLFNPVATITTLDLHHNRLRAVPVCDASSPLPRLTKLDLSSNTVTTVSETTFSACLKLRRLNLEHNSIASVHPKAFLQLTNLRQLLLNGNSIISVSNKMFNIRSLESLQLQYNFIEYVSPNAFNGTKLTTLNLHNNRISFLPQHFVSELNSAGGSVLYHEFHNNPWHCACLLEHLADVRRAGLYPPGRFSATGRACVFPGRAPCRRLAPAPLLRPAPTGRR